MWRERLLIFSKCWNQQFGRHEVLIRRVWRLGSDSNMIFMIYDDIFFKFCSYHAFFAKCHLTRMSSYWHDTRQFSAHTLGAPWPLCNSTRGYIGWQLNGRGGIFQDSSIPDGIFPVRFNMAAPYAPQMLVQVCLVLLVCLLCFIGVVWGPGLLRRNSLPKMKHSRWNKWRTLKFPRKWVYWRV